MVEDDATRLRLVELRSQDGYPRAIRFAPRVTLVTGFGSPERVGAWIANALVGPRPDGVSGVVEVAGRAMSLTDLPATLLPPRSSIVVSDAELDLARRNVVEPRFQRVVQRREAAENERARDELARAAAASRFATLEARLAEIEPALADTIERAANDEQRVKTMTVLEALLAEVDEAAMAARQPDPDALALASEWSTLVAQRAELAAVHPKMSVEDARRRVEVAEAALSLAKVDRAGPDDVGQLHARQRDVMGVSTELDSSDRDGTTNDERERALAAEREALAAKGHTHTSFLLGMIAPTSREHDIRIAEEMLDDAGEQLHQALTVDRLPTWPELAQRQLDLRSRAAGVLGAFPGDDVAGELRAFRPGAPALLEARARLEAGLTEHGIDPGTDVEVTAHSWIEAQHADPPMDHTARLAELSTDRDTVETELRAQAAELVAIAARLRDLDHRMGEFAVQESRLAAELATELENCSADDVERAVHDVLDEFVAGHRVPGRLPIIVAGASTAFEDTNRERTLRELERASERLQLVIVLDNGEVEAWAHRLGPDAGVWSPDVAARVDEAERARLESEEQARREAEQQAVRDAEERARRLAEERARALTDRRREERHDDEPAVRPLPYAARGGVLDLTGNDRSENVEVHTASGAHVVPVEPPVPPAPSLTSVPTGPDVDAPANAEFQGERVIDATEEIDATEPTGAGEGTVDEDDWWVPIVARPGQNRATRPVGEDLAQRRRRAEQLAADATSLTVHCDVHRHVETTLHCARCSLPFCDQCLALLGEPPALHCVDCALELSGVRSRGAAGPA